MAPLLPVNRGGQTGDKSSALVVGYHRCSPSQLAGD